MLESCLVTLEHFIALLTLPSEVSVGWTWFGPLTPLGPLGVAGRSLWGLSRLLLCMCDWCSNWMLAWELFSCFWCRATADKQLY